MSAACDLTPPGIDRAQLLSALEGRLLPAFVPGRRWFAAKGRGLRRLAVLDLEPLPIGVTGCFWYCFFEAALNDGTSQRYSLPLHLASDPNPEIAGDTERWVLGTIETAIGPIVVQDAVGSDLFCQAALAAMRENRALAFTTGEMRWSGSKHLSATDPAAAELPIRRPRIEQSHISVRFGERFFFKMYRRVQDGPNPEVELGRFLTDVSPFPQVAPVVGVIDWSAPGREIRTLGLLQGFVGSDENVFAGTRKHLEAMIGDVLHSRFSAERDAVFLNSVRLLGQRVGEMHRCLALPGTPPEFSPEPLQPADLFADSASVAAAIEGGLALLANAAGTLPPDTAPQVMELLTLRDALAARFFQPPMLKGPWPTKTRFHGDLHLEQVLATTDDFVLIDFEGEPGKPIAERRRKQCPLRDVAGMLRSFGYAVGAVRRTRPPEHSREDALQVEAFLDAWERRAGSSFLAGYRQGAADSSSLPKHPEDFALLTNLYQFEKALYELRYEVDNRPDWLIIPLSGLLRLAKSFT